MADASARVLKGVAVCAELTQTELSREAVAVMAKDLARYPEDQVLGALGRCRRELKPRCLTIAAILDRLDDGRPGPEEAWSMIPATEEPSVVWTDEMREAMGVAWPLLQVGDLIPARMAFLEHYRRAVARARDEARPVTWSFSPGRDRAGRELALLDAAEKGRISVDYVLACLPYHREDPALHTRLRVLAARGGKELPAALKALPAPYEPQEERKPMPEAARIAWRQLAEKFGFRGRHP